jgi:hypothetical protein
MRKINKKKIIILGIVTIGFIIGAIVIPIVITNNKNDDNDEKNKEKILNIKKYLKDQSNLNIILPKDKTDLDYSSNSKILDAIRKKMVLEIKGFEISDINLIDKKNKNNEEETEVALNEEEEGTPFIIIVDKEEFTLILKQSSSYTRETKLTFIKEFLKEDKNKNLELPKDYDGSLYSIDDNILNVVKKKLLNKIEKVSFEIDSNLISRKTEATKITSIANHDEDETLYEITIDNEDFTLKLKQLDYSEIEKTKISSIQTFLQTQENRDIILQTDYTGKDYENDVNILKNIRLKLSFKIEDITSNQSTLLINKKIGEEDITSVPTYDQSPIDYKITVGKQHFTLKIKQEKYTEEQVFIISEIKEFLGEASNLNVMLPKVDYNSDSQILDAIREKLIELVTFLTTEQDSIVLIEKKQPSRPITNVPNHDDAPITYEITVDDQDFSLNIKKQM